MRVRLRSDQLKLIAMGLMLLDHIAVGIINMLLTVVGPEYYFVLQYTGIIMRLLGRVAFPIFCYQLVTGLMYTHSRGKYLCKLAIFAAVSELPFNLLFKNKLFAPESQNVFFTLFIGAGVICLYEYVKEKFAVPVDAEENACVEVSADEESTYNSVDITNDNNATVGSNEGGKPEEVNITNTDNLRLQYNITETETELNNKTNIISHVSGEYKENKADIPVDIKQSQMPQLMIFAGIAIAACVLAEMIHTDYGAVGITYILTFYLLRYDREKLARYGAILLLVDIIAVALLRYLNVNKALIYLLAEAFCVVAIPLICCDNGVRKGGKALKYFGYAFYPAHILILYIVRVIIMRGFS